MNLVLNVIIIILESLYYSLFIKFSKNEGKIYKLLLNFIFISLIGIVIGTNNLFSYMLLIVMMLYSLKYIVKIKIGLYDLLIIFIMLLVKHIIEVPFSLLFYIFIKNIYIVTIIVGIIKLLIIFNLKEKLKLFYMKFNKLWINNNFYIRYIFTTFMLIYIILACLYCIIKWL